MSDVTLHTLPALSRRKKRIGRGLAGGGAKSGRGMKGQKSRAGYSRKAGFEGGQTPLYMRLPKGRGTKQVFSPQGRPLVEIGVHRLAAVSGDVLGYGVLRQAGLLPRGAKGAKLIGGGEVTRKLTVRVHAATPAAVAAIEAAGGKVEIIASQARTRVRPGTQ